MLIVVTAIKLIAEIALLAMCGQWLLGFLSGEGRHNNPFYVLLQLIGRPWIQVARWISPRGVLDRHLPLVAGFLLVMAWAGASVAKVGICLQIGMDSCR